MAKNEKKPGPAGKPEAGKAASAGKPSGKKKKKGVALGPILLIVLLLAVAGFFVAVIRFNWPPGLRGSIVSAVSKLDPDYVEMEAREAAVVIGEAALDERERKLAAQEQSLAQRKTELDERENKIDETELFNTPLYRRMLNAEELEDMESLSRTYARMSPETAAGILSELYTIENMAAILYYMAEGNAAAILESMDAGLAAEITQALLIG